MTQHHAVGKLYTKNGEYRYFTEGEQFVFWTDGIHQEYGQPSFAVDQWLDGAEEISLNMFDKIDETYTLDGQTRRVIDQVGTGRTSIIKFDTHNETCLKAAIWLHKATTNMLKEVTGIDFATPVQHGFNMVRVGKSSNYEVHYHKVLTTPAQHIFLIADLNIKSSRQASVEEAWKVTMQLVKAQEDKLKKMLLAINHIKSIQIP